MRIISITDAKKLVRRIYTYPGIHPQATMVIALRLDTGNNYEEKDTMLKKLHAIDQIE